MERTILIDGHAAVTDNGLGGFCFEFLPDDLLGQLTQGCLMTGKAQLMGSGSFCFTPAKKRIRSNELLIHKSAHGRLSGTRDRAVQLTLKAFASEAIDWRQAFVSEAVELVTSVIGPESMRMILSEIIKKMNY